MSSSNSSRNYTPVQEAWEVEAERATLRQVRTTMTRNDLTRLFSEHATDKDHGWARGALFASRLLSNGDLEVFADEWSRWVVTMVHFASWIAPRLTDNELEAAINVPVPNFLHAAGAHFDTLHLRAYLFDERTRRA